MKPIGRSFATGAVLALSVTLAGQALGEPMAVIEGVQDGALRGQLEAAVGDRRGAPGSPLEARRAAVSASRDAAALLRSEGYYDAQIAPDVGSKGGWQAVLKVTLGPRYVLKPSLIEWIGSAPDAAAQAAATKALHLDAGRPGRAADIIAAEGRIVASLKALGYADLAVQPRHVVVDHADHSVAPTFRLATGAKVRLGPARLRSGKVAKANWVAGLAPWKPGTIYDPALLAKFERRLIETSAFESATVDLAPADKSAAPGAPRAVDVTLVARKAHTLELGASYSTTEGSGVDAKLIRYNRLGVGDTLTLSAHLYDIQQKLDLEQDLPDWRRADQILKIGGGFLGDNTAAYSDLGGGVRAAVERHWSKTTFVTVGAAFDFADTREKDAVNLQAIPVGKDLQLFIGTTTLSWNLDRSNDLLNPTRGFRLHIEADPTVIAGGRNLEYVKTQAEVSKYLDFGHGFVLAGRLNVGSILGGSIPEVPADRRFFAGGGGSVRGYSYQGVGPRLSDNTPVGGVSLTEASVEFRQRLSSRWGLVVFADAGGLGQTAAPPLTGLQYGAGIGVRYDLGFGPLRLDIATPLNSRAGDSPVQVYISLGQAF